MGCQESIPYEIPHPVLDAFLRNKYAIWEDHRFTRAREPVNKWLNAKRKCKNEIGAMAIRPSTKRSRDYFNTHNKGWMPDSVGHALRG
jgi:hypothetical protein